MADCIARPIKGWSERLKEELLELHVSNLDRVQFGTRADFDKDPPPSTASHPAMIDIELARDAIKATGGASGVLRATLSNQAGLSAKEVSQQLSMLVESKQLIRISYGKMAWYAIVTPPGPANETARAIMENALA